MSHARFRTHRGADASGVSGTGHVLDGVLFHTGQVVVCWRTDVDAAKHGHSSLGIYPSFEAFHHIHVGAHPTNATRIEWLDCPPWFDQVAPAVVEAAMHRLRFGPGRGFAPVPPTVVIPPLAQPIPPAAPSTGDPLPGLGQTTAGSATVSEGGGLMGAVSTFLKQPHVVEAIEQMVKPPPDMPPGLHKIVFLRPDHDPPGAVGPSGSHVPPGPGPDLSLIAPLLPPPRVPPPSDVCPTCKQEIDVARAWVPIYVDGLMTGKRHPVGAPGCRQPGEGA